MGAFQVLQHFENFWFSAVDSTFWRAWSKCCQLMVHKSDVRADLCCGIMSLVSIKSWRFSSSEAFCASVPYMEQKGAKTAQSAGPPGSHLPTQLWSWLCSWWWFESDADVPGKKLRPEWTTAGFNVLKVLVFAYARHYVTVFLIFLCYTRGINSHSCNSASSSVSQCVRSFGYKWKSYGHCGDLNVQNKCFQQLPPPMCLFEWRTLSHLSRPAASGCILLKMDAWQSGMKGQEMTEWE